MEETGFSVGLASYGSGAAAFLVLLAVLLTGWRGRLQGALLVSAVAASALWAALVAWQSVDAYAAAKVLLTAESLRDVAWFLFLLGLLHGRESFGRLYRLILWGVLGILLLLAILPWLPADAAGWLSPKSFYIGYLIISVVGLWLVENLFRNTRPEQRWGIKYLCFGLGGMFAYDFFLYSHAVLFGTLDRTLWDARGAVNTLVVPLFAVSAARNPDWSLDVFVSRRLVFHTTSIVAAALYLLLMAAAGYYIRRYGGEWGGVLQVVFLFAALVVLVVLLFSGYMRAWLRVFLSKHFFNYRYDYREEWLSFTRRLADCRKWGDPRACVLSALARVVDSGRGILWLRCKEGPYAPVAHWNWSLPEAAVEDPESPLVRFLHDRKWVINLTELRCKPDVYDGLSLPAWLNSMDDAWLVVPLLDGDELIGFVLLAPPLAPVDVDWEVLDLLKTAAAQAASHLGQLEALQALAEARQFEGFHRLSAFILHDLKNIIAQQSLIVRNASKHRDNPDFIDDALGIMEHSVGKMVRLLGLLRSGLAEVHPVKINLARMIEDIVEELSGDRPVPVFHNSAAGVQVIADRDRLRAALRNVIQNAQQATVPDGRVEVGMKMEGEFILVRVEDDGCGMDADFIRERLFRPFDTTKGDTGMGVGAYESREYVRSLGGDIRVRSELGKGTRFDILLPGAGIGDNTREHVEGEAGSV